MKSVAVMTLMLVAGCLSATIPEVPEVPEVPKNLESVIVETAENKEAKASVDSVDYALLEYTEKDYQADTDAYLDAAVQADKFGCGSKLVCELHRRAESQLQQEEVLLRSMFTGKPLLAKSADGTKLSKTSGRGVLQYASFVGATAKNSETCTKLYPHCPFDSDTILIVFRAVGSSPLVKALTHPTPSHKLLPPKSQIA